ncbi:endonuclease/exonuclease/phosphatase family [Whalleya microplaca]|nr:endonuclease/exonuclease/phosphatase family [Whalleya microplaca]
MTVLTREISKLDTKWDFPVMVDIAENFSGSLSVVESDQPFTFKYSTTDANSTNWVGLWHSSRGGPVDGRKAESSLVWKYATGREGTVQLSTNSLLDGVYTAYFLADDAYQWLAEPIEVRLTSTPGGVAFPVHNITLHSAREGEEYQAAIGGLAIGGGNSTVNFTKVDGAAWVNVDSNGTLSGTPDIIGPSPVTVEATGADKSTTNLEISIPVQKSGAALQKLKVLTFNLWMGGTQVSGYHEKQLRFLLDSGADVVGLQESTGGHATRLAEALGWYYWDTGDSFSGMSRYPIVEKYKLTSKSGGMRIALDGGDSQLNFWFTHLGYTPYGPYDFCYDGMTVDEVMEREAKSGRTAQIKETITAMAGQIAGAKKIPVILVGDFNAPSHVDYTDAAKDKHCGYANVPWPTSKEPIDAGLTDSFREAHPDPHSTPGITWSPIYPFHNGTTGKPEPQDRIDFIYYAGNLKVLASDRVVVGEPAPYPNQRSNEWTSDHAAMLTTYRLLREV